MAAENGAGFGVQVFLGYVGRAQEKEGQGGGEVGEEHYQGGAQRVVRLGKDQRTDYRQSNIRSVTSLLRLRYVQRVGKKDLSQHRRASETSISTAQWLGLGPRQKKQTRAAVALC